MTRTASVLMVTLLALVGLPSRAAAQSEGAVRSNGTRVEKRFQKISISGIVGAEGKTLVGENDGRIWNVLNPESLKSSEGRRVKIRARAERDTSQVNVMTIWRTEERPSAKLGDAAFRR